MQPIQLLSCIDDFIIGAGNAEKVDNIIAVNAQAADKAVDCPAFRFCCPYQNGIMLLDFCELFRVNPNIFERCV